MSSIFTKMKHAFEHLGHDIEKVASSVAHNVGDLAKKLAHDVLNVLKDALAMTEALAQGNMKEAMQDLAKLGSDMEKTAADAATGTAETALKTLGDLHLGKGFDHLVGDVEKGLQTAKDAINKGTDAGMKDLVNSAEGIVEHSLNAVKDLAHGDLRGMMGELSNAGQDALNLAADLTPEGMGSTIAASTLSALHIGNDKINGALVGLMHGSVGKVVKAAVETGANAGATALANGGGDAVFAGATVLAAASMVPGGRGKRGGKTSTTSHSGTGPAKPHNDGHKDGKKADKKDEKKKDKKDDKDDKGNDKSPKIFVPPADNDAFTRNIKRV